MSEQRPDLSLFFDILRTLEHIEAPYMIIGAFASALYGSTRVSYDIDIVVNLAEKHIRALGVAYPPPRYYADPDQMRDSIRKRMMFNIIDSSRGEKADLIPLTMVTRYEQAFRHRIRQQVELPDGETLDIWCARPEDVIIGKLMAWAEGRSRKHETDIYEMLVFYYLDLDPTLMADFDEAYITIQARSLGDDVVELWEAIRQAARQEAERH